MLKQGNLIGLIILCVILAKAASLQAQPFRFLDGPPNSGDTLKVMTYNIHHGANKEEIQTVKEIGLFIKQSGVDLVGLQEVDSLCGRSGKQDQMKRLAEITGMHYTFKRHFAYDGGAYGLGILSRYPLEDIRGDRITSTSTDGSRKTLVLLSAQVNVPGGDKLRMASVHLALDQKTRMIQAKEILNYLPGDSPVILTGDMNAQPDNPVIDLLESRFTKTDVSLESTFPANTPDRKIDFIMVSKADIKNVTKTEVPTVQHSDHLPLISTIVMNLDPD